jgi:hypothetical protein
VTRETGTLWEGEHSATKHKITIRQKVDRNLLMCVYEQAKMICSIKLNFFGVVADEKHQLPKSDVIVEKCLEFLMPLVKDFLDGKMVAKELMPARTKKLADLGIGSREKAVARKRPAAADSLGDDIAPGKEKESKRIKSKAVAKAKPKDEDQPDDDEDAEGSIDGTAMSEQEGVHDGSASASEIQLQPPPLLDMIGMLELWNSTSPA